MEANADDPKLGLLLNDRYRIIKKLGEGGMGAVYEGKHEMINKRLAIKCLHPQFMANLEVVERFHREANAATSIGNEHIIEVTDVGTFDDGSPFIVMEYLEGVEFGDLLDQLGGIPVARMVHIVTQVCEALQAAHGRGIVHRDMKPENVYLIRRGGDDDFVKVLDFGISKMAESAEGLSSGLTKTGMALGTPYYMPPEQAQGVRDIDHRADVYAVGVIMFQALCNRLPFDAESYPALMVKIMTEPTPDLRTFRRDLPEGLAELVMRTMSKDRDVRIQSMSELATALRPYAQVEAAPVMVTDPPVSALDQTQAAGETTPFAWTQGEAAKAHAKGAPTDLNAFDQGDEGDEDGDTGDGSVAGAAPVLGTTQPMGAHQYRTPLLGAGVIAAAVIVAGVIISRAGPLPPQAAAPTTQPPVAAGQLPAKAPPAPSPQLQQPGAPAVPAVAPKPSEVQIAIGAKPAKARIFIGDVEFPNPMDAWRPRSLDPVRIRVEAKGHQTIEQLAIFDQDREMTFELERGRGVKVLKAMVGGDAKPKRKPSPATTTPAAAKPPAPREKPTPKPAPKPAKAPAANDGIYRGPTGTIRDEF